MALDETEHQQENDGQWHDRKEPGPPLRECVRSAVESYFLHLDGYAPFGLYKMVVNEVEGPLLEIALQQARGNYSRAADILGINRATLRKKLKQHRITA
uniref:Putative Fis-like DNA-binding protein n=1 Tax=Candidatus Kentrum sp. MB TaxID=2138164 RepID=A0A450XKN7_9GAMM|nr:MAG: Fis family transcriptional regulator, factor for inversion stimulation protein [Candidatus Kentron sp. MB]VFK34207.1 MAG: Fis family transcriptional regulator, factor for inversion stimulation protein [Candidatus Kentron sp. MB]VFK76461.1 MAG: Fis family transcriptional regulator, factor for inversion stimulation protein [Candidatus Kentron sp. MB]